jgi:hypothetical protein
VVVVDPSGEETVTVLVTLLVEELPLVPLAEPLLSEEDVDDDASLDVAPPDCSRELSETVMLVPVVDEMLVISDIPQM